jgi:hypothetical protein
MIVEYEGVMRKLCTIGFTRKDASFYVIPHGPTEDYLFGAHQVGRNGGWTRIDAAETGSSSELPPHLSMHESGQVHAHANGLKAGPLTVPPLSQWRGEHAATVVTDGPFDTLEVLDGPVRSGRRFDWVTKPKGGSLSGKVVVFINGTEESFAADCHAIVSIFREHLRAPLHVGLQLTGQEPVRNTPAVTVIGGWVPNLPMPGQHVLYITHGVPSDKSAG